MQFAPPHASWQTHPLCQTLYIDCRQVFSATTSTPPSGLAGTFDQYHAQDPGNLPGGAIVNAGHGRP